MQQLTHRVAVGLLLLASVARAEQELPVYPGTVHTRIGNDMVIDGEYFRLSYFTTKDSIRTVANYFVSFWKEQGLPVTVDGDEHTDVVVSAFYTREGLQRSVVLHPQGGKTLGFTVLRDLWVRPPSKPSPGMLKLEGTLYTSDISTRDDPGASRQRGSLIEGSVDTTRASLVRQMTDSGFSLLRETGKREGGKRILVLEHTKDQQQVVSVLTELDGNATVLSQTWIGSDRPDGMPNDTWRKNAHPEPKP